MKLQTKAFAFLMSATLAGPAMAQTASPQPAQPGSSVPMTQPGQTMPQGAGQQGAMRPLASPQPNQMLSSDLRGTTVYGANNESIGQISDLLLDRDGRVAAVILGVGGFLGIGEKDVAVPYPALEIMAENRAAGAGARGANTSVTGSVVGGAAPAGTVQPGTVQPNTVSGVGTAGTAVAPANPSAGERVATINPQRVVLRGMTRADLENAPAFRADGRAAR